MLRIALARVPALIRVLLLTLVAAAGGVNGGGLRAHPEIEGALARLNPLIAASPEDAELYLQRGELYARHEEWLVAEANYLRAAELAPQHPRLALARGALALAIGRCDEARAFFDAALARNPHDAEALVLRARTHAHGGASKTSTPTATAPVATNAATTTTAEAAAALADLDAALALIAAPPPELYLERAALLPPAAAIRSLDEGIARLGPAITLHLRALALEESLGHTEAALGRLRTLTNQSERKESWLKRQGDLLARAGRAHEAREAYRAAVAALAALPDWLRASPHATRLAAELAELTADLAEPARPAASAQSAAPADLTAAGSG